MICLLRVEMIYFAIRYQLCIRIIARQPRSSPTMRLAACECLQQTHCVLVVCSRIATSGWQFALLSCNVLYHVLVRACVRALMNVCVFNKSLLAAYGAHLVLRALDADLDCNLR